MGDEKRGKAFVRMLHPVNGTLHSGGITGEACAKDGCFPVVVTPLLPDDPKPGETWLLPSGETVEILSPPYAGVVVVRSSSLRVGEAIGYDVARLRRPPVLKTFRVRGSDVTVQAPDRDDAIARLAASLEEVT